MNRQLIMGLDEHLLATFAVAILLLGFVYALSGDQQSQQSQQAELISFNQTGASCASPNAGGVSLDREETEEGKQAITITGAFSTPNPCYFVTGDLEETEPDLIALKVVSKSEGGMCVQCVGQVSYQAQIEASGFNSLVVYHDDQQVEQFSLENGD